MPPSPQRSIHVVAAVIADVRGRILLARRTDGRDLAGLWEFPGGKREPGESPEAALVRELQEELGITVQVGAPLISVPQQYPDKRLTLDVRHVTHGRGARAGSKARRWLGGPGKLVRYPMAPADRPVVAALLQSDHYLVTPEPGADGTGWLASLSGALSSGIRRVQLRARSPESQPGWRGLAADAVALCHKAKAEVLVNGDIGLAGELGIGLHLRASQLAGMSARPVGDGQLVSASCHDANELKLPSPGCDFAVLAASYPPPRTGWRTLGWEGLPRCVNRYRCPVRHRRPGTSGPRPRRQHGAQGIAAIAAYGPPVL